MNAATLVPLLSVLAPTPAPDGARFGHSVATADVNGDGYADLIVGEPRADGDGTDAGRVLVYLGSAGGPASTPAWTKRGRQAGARFGECVARAGDVNGDGYDDVVVGAPGSDGAAPTITSGPGAATLERGLTDAGAVFVYLGSPTGLSAAAAVVCRGAELRERFGISVDSAGDVDDDGYDDVIVGATGTGADVGAAFVFRGSPSGPPDFPTWVIHGDQAHSRFGFAVAGIGDLDGDGFGDVAVGAPDELTFGIDQGQAFVYRGSAAGIATTPYSILFGDGEMGWSVAAGGNLAGLGATVLVGDPGRDTQGGGHSMLDDAGFAGAFSDPNQLFAFTTGPVEHARHGTSVAAVGDPDGDGTVEYAIGQPGTDLGAVRIIEIPGGSIARAGSQSASQFGFDVAGGDLDGDGFDDVVVSEPAWDGAATDAGRVVVYRGAASGLGASPAWILVAP